jgi:uncharacterized protein (DUF2461 family)
MFRFTRRKKMQPFDLKPAFSFLRNLAENNDRSWFEQHRSEYLRAKDAAELARAFERAQR